MKIYCECKYIANENLVQMKILCKSRANGNLVHMEISCKWKSRVNANLV